MRQIWYAAALAALATAVAGPSALAQFEDYTFNIDWHMGQLDGSGTQDDPYEVLSGQPLDIWAHVGKEGHEGELYHIENVSACIWHEGEGESTWIYDQIAGECEWHEFCEWFPWGTLTLFGEYCNTVGMQADITIWSESQGEAGPLYSNKLYFHIVPEPATFTSLAGLLLGAVTIGWTRLRKP
jgi:hypothetical protein